MSAISGFCEKCNKFRKRHCDGNRNTCMSILFDTIEALQQENEQLQAQVAQMREACILGYSYLSLIFHRADIKNWNEVGMCSVKDIKHVLNELESAYKDGNTPADYHNPADMEALRKERYSMNDLIIIKE